MHEVRDGLEVECQDISTETRRHRAPIDNDCVAQAYLRDHQKIHVVSAKAIAWVEASDLAGDTGKDE